MVNYSMFKLILLNSIGILYIISSISYVVVIFHTSRNFWSRWSSMSSRYSLKSRSQSLIFLVLIMIKVTFFQFKHKCKIHASSHPYPWFVSFGNAFCFLVNHSLFVGYTSLLLISNFWRLQSLPILADAIPPDHVFFRRKEVWICMMTFPASIL